MNRKIFISLIALPVALFFVSTVLIGASSPDSKRMAHVPDYGAAHQADGLAIGKTQLFEKNCVRIEKEMKIDAALSQAQNETILQNRQKRDYHDNENFVLSRDKRIGKHFNNLIERKLIRPLKNARLEGYSAKSFSRCPSGFHYRLVQTPDKVEKLVTGQVIHSHGCMGVVYADFKIDKNSGETELLVSEEFGYVSVREWIRLRKLV